MKPGSARELERRFQVLKQQVGTVRAMVERRRTDAGPQRVHDHFTAARLQWPVRPAGV
jgi:hypothetical protein